MHNPYAYFEYLITDNLYVTTYIPFVEQNNRNLNSNPNCLHSHHIILFPHAYIKPTLRTCDNNVNTNSTYNNYWKNNLS